MAASQNSTVGLTVKATSLRGLATYGDVLIGNRAFEFYNERNPEDYIQIPWDEVDHVEAEVVGRRKITRFIIFTHRDGKYAFSTRDNVATLRAVREHVGRERVRQGMGFFEVMRLGLLSVGRRVRSLFCRG